MQEQLPRGDLKPIAQALLAGEGVKIKLLDLLDASIFVKYRRMHYSIKNIK